MTESHDDSNARTPGAWRMAAFTVLAALGLLCSAALVAVWLFDPAPNTFGFELGKALLQLLAVIVVGGVLALVTSNYQRERDEFRRSEERARDEILEADQRARDEHRDLQERSDTVLRDLLDDALKSFHDVKRARRILRANRSWTHEGNEHIDRATYEAQIAVMNDAQLDFERMRILARIIRDSRVNEDLLARRFTTIEKYLSTLLTEYERTRRTLGPESRLALEDLEVLSGCIDESRKDIFRRSVAHPLKAIVAQLQAALIVPLPPGGHDARSFVASVDAKTITH